MSSATPSPNLILNLRTELMRQPPFAEMAPAHVDRFIAESTQAYFAPDEVVLEPAMGPVRALYLLRQGSITGRRGIAEMSGGLQYEVGDLFPVGSVLGARPVTSTYTANEDSFCLLLPADRVRALARDSAPFADFLQRRALHFFELSQRAVQASYASQTLAEQSLEARLATLPRKTPLACTPDTPLQLALAQMHERRVGSVLVVDAGGAPVGILTRHDILGRVTLPALPLVTPIVRVMSQPLRTLDVDDTLQDAALLMSRHGIRHMPVCEDGKVVNIVSERDLFALQRLSLKQLSTRIRSAHSLLELQRAAVDIRGFARNLLGQGVHARQLTELISHLNDVLTESLVQMQARAHGMDLQRACWLAFGSEGRSEQTIATDQDNGLIFESDDPERDRPAWLKFARAVNEALDACGYPLCKGNVMASNPACCLAPAEWRARFAHWIEHGAPEDLLNASIYFDLRPLVGRVELAKELREMLAVEPARVPRFIKQMADNSLRSRAPLNWRGAIDAQTVGGREMFDLKLRGTALFVDAARLYALALGHDALGTRERLTEMARSLGVEAQEGEAWVTAFEFLQMLRLRVQLQRTSAGDALPDEPNLIELASLNELDRKLLKETLRVAKQLQQRIELDYAR
jgi:CBS domain-containing protein